MPTSRPLWQQVLLVMSALAVLVSLGAVAAYQVDYQTEEQDLREETSRLAAFVTVQIKDQVQRQGTSGATVASVSGLFGQLPLPDGSLLTLTDQDSRILARSVDADRYVGTLTQGAASAARPPSSLPAVEQRVGLDGIERIFAHGLIPEGPWVLSVGIPVSVARERTSPSIPLVAFGTMALQLARDSGPDAGERAGHTCGARRPVGDGDQRPGRRRTESAARQPHRHHQPVA
jgi:hypothetical protein